MTRGHEGEPPINFSKRLKEKQDLIQQQPTTALIRRMWSTLTGWQRTSLFDRMSNEETIELVESLPPVPEDELTSMLAKANRAVFIRALPSGSEEDVEKNHPDKD